jgi:hypothetical protein
MYMHVCMFVPVKLVRCRLRAVQIHFPYIKSVYIGTRNTTFVSVVCTTQLERFLIRPYDTKVELHVPKWPFTLLSASARQPGPKHDRSVHFRFRFRAAEVPPRPLFAHRLHHQLQGQAGDQEQVIKLRRRAGRKLKSTEVSKLSNIEQTEICWMSKQWRVNVNRLKWVNWEIESKLSLT